MYIDVSTYQHTIDYPTLAQTGQVTGVIAKLGGGDNGIYVDSQWVVNRVGIRATGFRLGSYYFNGPADTPTQAADFQFANMGYQLGDLVVIDVEGHGTAWAPAQVYEWCRRMLWHGVAISDLLVYMSENAENTQDWSAVVTLGVELWVAAYRTNNGQPGTPPNLIHWARWVLWQYTSLGRLPGISAYVDLSLIAPDWAGNTVTPLTQTKRHRMTTLYFDLSTQATTPLWGLGGDSPGTPANWLETIDSTVATAWAVAHGNAVHLSHASYLSFRNVYLSPLNVNIPPTPTTPTPATTPPSSYTLVGSLTPTK